MKLNVVLLFFFLPFFKQETILKVILVKSGAVNPPRILSGIRKTGFHRIESVKQLY